VVYTNGIAALLECSAFARLHGALRNHVVSPVALAAAIAAAGLLAMGPSGWMTQAAAQELVRPDPPSPNVDEAAPDETAAPNEAPRKRRRPRDAMGAPAATALPAPMAVTADGRSKPTLCAEDDNVYVTFTNSRLRHFRIDARPPAVIGSIVVDNTAPDFTDCAIADQPPGPEDKIDRVVMFEDETMMLVGYRHSEFWRKGDVPLKVGDREEHALHLVQLFTKTPKGPYEYLVLYPLDGYWRARPLPPERLEQVAYGTSFLVGAVEEQKRPVVALKSIKFTPTVKSFELTYPGGDVATLRVTGLSEKAASMEVVFEKPVANRPFAAFRSMFVTQDNADATHVTWKEPRGKAWQSKPVMDFYGAWASEFRLGRPGFSRHNTSAPDTLIYDFMPD
jgi:hypothetical protein